MYSMANRMPADYSLYLVTDSTSAILGKNDLASVVAAAVKGGRFNDASLIKWTNKVQASQSYNIVIKQAKQQT